MKKNIDSKNDYGDRVHQQLIKWVAGESNHNNIDNECCPDFSCCKPNLKASKKIREMYYEAYRKKNERIKMKMLAEFLGKGLANMGYTSTLSNGKTIKPSKIDPFHVES